MNSEETAVALTDRSTKRYAEQQGLSLEAAQVRRYWEGQLQLTRFDLSAHLVIRGRMVLSGYALRDAKVLSRRLFGIGRNRKHSPGKLMREAAGNAIRCGMRREVAKAILNHALDWHGLGEEE